MRKIVLIMILAFAVVGAADDCKIFAVGKIICKNSEYGITAIYKKQKGNQWIAKAYAEERVKRQTEAVVVKKFFNVNLFETCLEGFKRLLRMSLGSLACYKWLCHAKKMLIDLKNH